MSVILLHGSLIGRSCLVPGVSGGLLVRGLPRAAIDLRSPRVAHGFGSLLGSLVAPLVSLVLLGWCSSPGVARGVAWLGVATVLVVVLDLLCLKGALAIPVQVVISVDIVAIGVVW